LSVNLDQGDFPLFSTVKCSGAIVKSGHIHAFRASVLGANDGLLSTASLLAGVAAGRASHEQILLAGAAALVAGAFAIAAGE